MSMRAILLVGIFSYVAIDIGQSTVDSSVESGFQQDLLMEVVHPSKVESGSKLLRSRLSDIEEATVTGMVDYGKMSLRVAQKIMSDLLKAEIPLSETSVKAIKLIVRLLHKAEYYTENVARMNKMVENILRVAKSANSAK